MLLKLVNRRNCPIHATIIDDQDVKLPARLGQRLDDTRNECSECSFFIERRQNDADFCRSDSDLSLRSRLVLGIAASGDVAVMLRLIAE